MARKPMQDTEPAAKDISGRTPTKGRTPVQDVTHRFGFHPATKTTGPVHDQVRTKHANVGRWILKNVPAGRHQSLALTALQESMMWCNAAVACDTEE